jgi:hypothetical protein
MTTGMEAVVVLEALPRDLCPQVLPRPSHIHHNPIHIYETRGQGVEAMGTAIRNAHAPNLLDLHGLK